jgi:hypothetical protein
MKGMNMKIPRPVALRTSLTFDETITLYSTLNIIVTGRRTKSKVAIFQFGK